MLKVLIIFRKFLKLKSSFTISLALLTELYEQDRNYSRTRLWPKERLQITFPELSFLFYSKNIPQIVFANMNNISCTDFIVSKMFQFVDDKLRTDILCLVQNKCLFFIFHNMYYSGFIAKY